MALPSSKESTARQYIRNPHRHLGLHELEGGKKVVRLWRPDAPHMHIELFGKILEMKKSSPEGLFELEVPSNTTFADYRVYHQGGLLAHDPYAFLPTFGEMDAYLFARGVHYKLYEAMGARVWTQQGVQGVKFSVWAPHARSICLVADFNFWDGRVNPLRQLE
ncbi:MAG: hypothetical protein HYX67_13760, partial [Candidatus Melainabacteria bacterium]|nr:hypothetical protein [Candidatus Melainabacteria bacterium]